MVIGPVTVVVFRSVSSDRPRTVVVIPSEREDIHPSKMTLLWPTKFIDVNVVEYVNPLDFC
jgi:hypothetical protein